MRCYFIQKLDIKYQAGGMPKIGYLGKPRKQFIEKNIISGILLRALTEKEVLSLAPYLDPISNYKVMHPDHVSWVHCTPKEIKALSYEEMKFLQAVKNCNDRLNALPKLDWIGSLHLGSGAFLDMPTVFTQQIKVIIRYIGSLADGEPGTFIGVELLVSILFIVHTHVVSLASIKCHICLHIGFCNFH